MQVRRCISGSNKGGREGAVGELTPAFSPPLLGKRNFIFLLGARERIVVATLSFFFSHLGLEKIVKNTGVVEEK
jgi:hypothetical protein